MKSFKIDYNVAKTAVARELAGFIWALAIELPLAA
jgi:hypothetical protein